MAARADLILIAPATANSLAKLANGICDDLLSTMVLASSNPIMVAPAMNPRMWEHPATQQNMAVLENHLRYIIVPPEVGEVACGDWGQANGCS